MTEKIIEAETKIVLCEILELLKDAKKAGKTIDDLIKAFERQVKK